jgi:hypothetical protein
VGDSPETEVLLEVDDEGMSTGVEVERELPDDQIPDERIVEPFDPAKIDVVTRNATVNLLLARLRRGALDLSPDFQRLMGIWNSRSQSRLIESMLLRIPLPTFYAAEVDDEKWAVVDGIQRLSTIARFVSPELIGSEPLHLRGLQYLKRYQGFTYEELPGALQTRIDETELIVHLIRSGTPEPVMFNIFARLNTGGRPLTSQELRHALIPGRARTVLSDLAQSQPFLAATQGSIKPARMADREMVLRYLAFRLTDPADYKGGDLDAFLSSAMSQISAMPESRIEGMEQDFARTMWAAHEIFGDYAFRKRKRHSSYRLPVNRPLFETESIGLAKLSDSDFTVLRERRDLVEERFLDLMDDASFVDSISYATGDSTRLRFRFGAVEEMLRSVLVE